MECHTYGKYQKYIKSSSEFKSLCTAYITKILNINIKKVYKAKHTRIRLI